MGSANRKICLATVTTENYLPGTLVMIGSFLKCHPGFKGDVVIIHDDLSETALACLEKALGRIRFEPVSSDLKDRVARLEASRPPLGGRRSRFYSLDAFRLGGYHKVLFCDSDLLFRQPVSELFDSKEALLCCGDGPFHRGHRRGATSFDEIREPSQVGTEGALERTFNAGFLLIDAALLDGRHFAGLLALLTPEAWHDVKTHHTDQVIYNRYFAQQQTLLSAKYNYLLYHDENIRTKEGLTVADAKVLHFNGPRKKPWLVAAMLGAAMQSPTLVVALRLWYEDFIHCLTAVHLQPALGILDSRAVS